MAACASLPPPTAVPPATLSPYAGYSSPVYAAARMWLCRPDLPADACRGNLDATEIRPDGTRAPAPHVRATAAAVDCFYVYPTVDMGLLHGNHLEFDDLRPMTDATLAQAARFTEVCDVYVPLYRQVTIGTYAFGKADRERRLAVAFSDVADAFAHYLGQYNRGHPVVLVGHSQGAEMVVRLLQRYFEHDPALRARLLVGIAIGAQVETAQGRRDGGTFESLPLCTRPEEAGCVIAFRSHPAGRDPSPGRRLAPRAGNEVACVNPAGVGTDEARPLTRTYLPVKGALSRSLRGIEKVPTPFVLYRSLFEARCVDGPGGYRYLAVARTKAPGDARRSPIDLDAGVFNTRFGLHPFDMQFVQGDLIDLIARKAAATAKR